MSLWESRISWGASFFGSVVWTSFVLTTMSLSHIVLFLCESCVRVAITIRDAQRTRVQIAIQSSCRHSTTIATGSVLCDRGSWKFVKSWLDINNITHQRYIYIYTHIYTRGGSVGWDTALQAGRSRVRFPMVSLEFFIYIIVPVALWPWSRLSL
jgi:hypothetical protein